MLNVEPIVPDLTPTAGASRRPRKLTWLPQHAGADDGLRSRLEEVAALPFVEHVLALPDLHQKAGMEVPSSLSIRTRGMVVPEFTSVAVNDGMGVIVTDLHRDAFDADSVRRFFHAIARHAASSPLDTNRYSLSAADLRACLTTGARAAVRRYELPGTWLDRFEDGGCVADWPGGEPRVEETVPWLMLRHHATRSEMGLNFGGNHFLEVQEVEWVRDPEQAARWGLRTGQVVVMYHLGPGTFGGTLLHHLNRRLKTARARVPLYFASKLLFHYVQRLRTGRLGEKWALHFRRNDLTPLATDSEAGRFFHRALTLATNAGSAYRMATVRAVMDGLAETLGPGVRCDLLCDVSHNGIQFEPGANGGTWTARHNACRLAEGRAAIVAGDADVPSYLAIGGSPEATGIDSYDHGAGHLIAGARRAGRLVPATGQSTRLRMTRGRNARIVSESNLPLRGAEPIEQLMDRFEANGAMRPVVRLRPIATLKN